MRKRIIAIALTALIVAFFAVSAHAAFVTFVADSLFNAKNYGEAVKHYTNIAGQYFVNATKSETVTYMFGYENTKKIYINRAADNAKVALYSFYMKALCDIYLKNYAAAVADVSNAVRCYSFDKTLTPKSLTSTGNPEVVRIALPQNVIAEYAAKINALPLPAGEMLKALERTARERFAVGTQLANTPQGPVYDQLMARFMALSEQEKSFVEFISFKIGQDLDAKKFDSFNALVAFLKSYKPIDRSVTSSVDVGDRTIQKMTTIGLNCNSAGDLQTGTLFHTEMQKLISAVSYIKGYLATSGGM